MMYKLLSASLLFLITSYGFAAKDTLNTSDWPNLTISYIIINNTGNYIPIEIKLFDDTTMLQAPNPMPPGRNVYISQADYHTLYRYRMVIGNYCHATEMSGFGHSIDHDGSGRCHMISAGGETYLSIE